MIEQHKLITEGAGAVSVAAVMFNKVPVKGKNVVCLLSGGNIDVTILSKVIERGLLKSGRSDTLMIQLEDKPGQLQGVSSTIAKYGANVTGVFYEKPVKAVILQTVYYELMWKHAILITFIHCVKV